MRQIILLLAGLAVNCWGQDTLKVEELRKIYPIKSRNTIGAPCLPWKVSEVHIWPLPDTTKIYLHYADGGCDTILAMPSDKKPKRPTEPGVLYAVAMLAAQTQREAITIADLEGWLKYYYDDSTMEIVGAGQSWMLPVNPPIIKFERYDTVYTHKDPLDLNGFLQWLKRKERK